MPDPNGLSERVAVLRVRLDGIEQDVGEIKTDLRQFRGEWNNSRRGLTRAEKIALTGAGSAVVAAIIAAIALISGGVA